MLKERITMKKYEYKFVEIPKKTGLRVKSGETFEECKKVLSKKLNKDGD